MHFYELHTKYLQLANSMTFCEIFQTYIKDMSLRKLQYLWVRPNKREPCHISSEEIQIGHGLDKPSLGNFSSCIGYRKTILIATNKIFERFCIEIPKEKYCNEHTKGDFSQSSHKEVTRCTGILWFMRFCLLRFIILSFFFHFWSHVFDLAGFYRKIVQFSSSEKSLYESKKSWRPCHKSEATVF